MDKAPAYGAGDSGFESRYGLFPFYVRSCARGLVVMIVACQVGERIFCRFLTLRLQIGDFDLMQIEQFWAPKRDSFELLDQRKFEILTHASFFDAAKWDLSPHNFANLIF